MKTGIFLMAMMAVMAVSYAQAPAKVPAKKDMIERVQPNGYVLRTFLRGDERKHWSMTEDGWQILETDKGWFKYAKTNRKGEVVVHWRKAHNAEDRGCCERKWLEKKGIKKHI